MPHQVHKVVKNVSQPTQYAWVRRTHILGLTDGYGLKTFDGPLYTNNYKFAVFGDQHNEWEHFDSNITGTIGITSGTTQVLGTSTNFTAQLSPGDKIVLFGEQHYVDTVVDNTTLNLTQLYTGNNLAGVEMWKI